MTYAHVVGNCRDAVKNPATGKPVDKRAVYMVFRERRYDEEEDLSNTWTNTARLARTALPKETKVKRHNWAEWLRGLHHTDAWYCTNFVWADIWNSVFPRTEKRAGEQALSRKAGKGWMSEGCDGWGIN